MYKIGQYFTWKDYWIIYVEDLLQIMGTGYNVSTFMIIKHMCQALSVDNWHLLQSLVSYLVNLFNVEWAVLETLNCVIHWFINSLINKKWE